MQTTPHLRDTRACVNCKRGCVVQAPASRTRSCPVLRPRFARHTYRTLTSLASDARMDTTKEGLKERDVHLVVLQHGLWGRPEDLARLAAFLQAAFNAAAARQQLQDRMVVLNSTCNARVLTYDGIDVCGTRLAELVHEKVEQQQQEGACVTKLSLIGYSLGGLFCRYAAGKLYVAGLFEQVQPVNLITIATPHLGSFKEPSSWMARFFNVNVPIVASRSGMQLVLADADYSVPWLVQQQQRHNQAQRQHQHQHGQQHQQQHGQQQQQLHAQAHQEQAQQQQHHQQQQRQQQAESRQHGVEAARVDTTSCRQQQQENSIAAHSESDEQQQPNTKQQQQQVVSLPPGVDPSEPVPLLLLMAHPAGPFHKALAAFRTRICCANIKHDTTVPYCTAAICTANPYEQQQPVSVNAQLYPSVVQPVREGEQLAAFPGAKGRYRMLLFVLFLPLFPLFYGYSAAKGLLHHREARKRPVDAAWLQQYQAAAEAVGAGMNPFSRQASRQLQERLAQQQDTASAGEQGGTAENTGSTAGVAAVMPGMLPRSGASRAPAALEGSSDSSSSRPDGSAGKGLQQLLRASSGGTQRQQHGAGLHTQADSNAAAVAADRVDEDARDAALDELYPATAAAAAGDAGDETEDQVLRASGSGAVLLSRQASRQASRRLTAAGSLSERDGIVEAEPDSGEAWLLQQQQRWMAQQLFDALPPGVVGQRRWGVQGGALFSSSGAGADTSTEAEGVERQRQLADTAEPQAAAAAADTDGDAEVAGSSAHSSSGSGEKDSAAASGACLSEGGWHRVDVWTGHVHAHATIIVRDKRYESQSRDLFAYLVDHMSL